MSDAQQGNNSFESLSFKEFFVAMGEHLTELRNRFIISIAVLLITVVIGIIFAEPIMQFLCAPIGGMEKLKAIEITENVSAVFRVALLSGFILALPIITYEMLAFILPALRSNEKHYVFTFLPLLVTFFLAGVVFAYYVILPAAIPFLVSFLGIETEVRPSNYISFTTNMLFWIGLVFEMPMVIYIAARVKLVTAVMLLKNWRQAVVVCSIIAMIITPTVDPINMLLLMFPLIGLFFLSILFAKIAENKYANK